MSLSRILLLWDDFREHLVYLHGLVAVCEVVDDGKRLLETGAACERHVRDQLAHCDDDLERVRKKEKKKNCLNGLNREKVK